MWAKLLLVGSLAFLCGCSPASVLELSVEATNMAPLTSDQQVVARALSALVRSDWDEYASLVADDVVLVVGDMRARGKGVLAEYHQGLRTYGVKRLLSFSFLDQTREPVDSVFVRETYHLQVGNGTGHVARDIGYVVANGLIQVVLLPADDAWRRQLP